LTFKGRGSTHDDFVMLLVLAALVDIERGLQGSPIFEAQRERSRINHDFRAWQLGHWFAGTAHDHTEIFDRRTGIVYPDAQSYRWELQRRKLDTAQTEDERMAILQGRILPGSREAILWNRQCGLNDEGSKKE
jgi:hypothetical protein